MPFLARIAAAGPAGARTEALMLLLRLAVDWHDTYDLPLGIDTAAWHATAISPEESLRWYDEQIAAETDEARLKNLREGREYCAAGHPIDAREGALRSYDAVRAQLPLLIPLLDDPDPEVRSRCAYLLGWFPEEAGTVADPLLRRLETERDPVTAATSAALLCRSTSHRSSCCSTSTPRPRPYPATEEPFSDDQRAAGEDGTRMQKATTC
ncbi:HEAT repeat domain-containing protein [Kitasatospora sp. NPDC008115]|uniref:HEAT repeat domain-containing protein n=1 Tax=Kitasatospora sp. NPDC008115 TaxID=3364022 RepID=UPI0036E2B610